MKESTRRRVLEAMSRLGFQPNAMARGLRGSQTQLIGICFQEIGTPVLARKMSILQSHLRMERHRAIIELAGGDPILEEEVIRHFLSMRVDGIVLAGSTLAPDNPLLEQLQEGPVVVVAIDPANALPLPQVNLDRELAMDLKLQHLLDLGHRRIAILGVESDNLYGGRRMQGLRKAARHHQMDFKSDFVSLSLPGYGLQDYSYGDRLAQEYLSLEDRPTALLCLNDRIALGASRAIQQAGLRIPEDCSVIGFDNLEASAWSQPALTTIDQQIELMMSTTVAILMQAVRFRDVTPPNQMIRPALCVRESTGPVRGSVRPGSCP